MKRAFGILVVALGLGVPFRLAAQDAITANFPRYNWQPTQAPPGADYVGDKVCANCHSSIVATQRLSPMARALERASECVILHRHPVLTARLGRYTYRIVSRGGELFAWIHTKTADLKSTGPRYLLPLLGALIYLTRPPVSGRNMVIWQYER